MNIKKFLMIGLFLAIPLLLLAQDAPKTDIQELGYVSYTEGDVSFKSSSILAGDEVSTQKGRAEVDLNGDFVRINEHSSVGFSALEDSILVDIRYGEVYLDTKNEIEVQTPAERFSIQGVYRIEVDRYKTRKYRNPMLEDKFDKWNYQREKELAGYEGPRRRIYQEPDSYFDWAWYPYWSWPWVDWYVGWYPAWYYYGYYPHMWNSYWYWTSWNLGWYPYWYWTRGYYSSFYPYYGYNYPYYSRYYYGDSNYYRGQTIIRKNELQRPDRTTAPTLTRRAGIANTQLRSTRSTYPSRISSRELNRITTRSIRPNSSFRSSPRVSLRSFSQPRYYSRPSISRFSSFSRSFSGPSSRSFSSFRSPSIRSGSIRRR